MAHLACFFMVFHVTLRSIWGEEHLCYTGNVEIAGKTLSVQQATDAFDKSAKVSAVDSLETSEPFANFLGDARVCQHKCFGQMFRASSETLIGNLGQQITSLDAQQLTVSAFAGSFKACYPSPKDRSHVKTFAKKIVDGMGKPMKYPDALFPKAAPCNGVPGQTPEGRARFVASFRQRFPEALAELSEAHPEVHQALVANAKNCQSQCLTTTMSLAVQNLWDSGRFAVSESEALSLEALTGAVEACFPEVSHRGVMVFAHQVVDALNDDLDFVRLHATSQMESSASYSVSFIGAGAVCLTAIMLLVIRWRRRACGKTQQDQETKNLLPEEDVCE
eukprot:gnl/MRDRNA2_/MRDRNA2_80849_c0_seq1.p1 gnl/MRDRNA2_/MRDRNA2_80849_c0~~gnl/MRDRNA2_/MRDRNA2_80849_c0_seq1.p1  ORF type:complete len:363 (-),score=64.19 gnl/MRDRNA2_/MRDRNA2_80849_c0_seq1:445-1446(-)